MRSSLLQTFPNISIEALDISSECRKSLFSVDVCLVPAYEKLLNTDRFVKQYVFIPYYPSAYFLVDRIKEDIMREFEMKERYRNGEIDKII